MIQEDADGEAILKDFYRRECRSAAPDIEAYWELLQETRNRKIMEELSYPEAYDKAFFEEAGRLLAAAEDKLTDEPETYRKRVSFLRAGLGFTRLMIGVRDQMNTYHKSAGTNAAAAERIRANWKKLKEIAENNLMNYKFFQPGQRYSRGLHPDYE